MSLSFMVAPNLIVFYTQSIYSCPIKDSQLNYLFTWLDLKKIVYKIKLDYAVRYGYSIRWFPGSIDLAGGFLFKKFMFQLFQIHIY